MKRTVLILFIAATMISGCTEKTKILPAGEEIVSITIIDLPAEIRLFEGYTQETAFSVIVQNEEGEGLPGREVELAIVNDEGSISPSTATTDANGVIQAVLTITVPPGERIFQISATYRGNVTFASIQLFGSPAPASIEFLRVEDDDWTDHFRNLAAVVKDINGNPIPDVGLEFTLIPFEIGQPTYGSVTKFVNTNEAGVAVTVFNSEGKHGLQKIRCEIVDDNSGDPLTKESSLSFRSTEYYITFHPRSEFIYADGLGRSQVYIDMVVTDSRGVGAEISQSDITFTTDNEYAVMDGWTFDYIGDPESDPEIQLPVLVTVTARFEKGKVSESVGIMVRENNPLTRIELVASDNEAIIGGDDFVELTANCYFEKGYPPTDEIEIYFVADKGECSPYREFVNIEDSKVTTYFGAVFESGLAHITANYEDAFVEIVSNAVEIIIIENNAVTRIELPANARQLYANGIDSSEVRATCFLSDGSPAPNGTPVMFEADSGHFVNDLISVSGNAGQAHNYYISGEEAGTAHLTARYEDEVDTVLSNVVEIELVSGPEIVVSLTADPTVIPFGGTSWITARLTDNRGNPVREGTYVSFGSTMGTITPSVITDENGEAVAIFRAGLESGRAGMFVGTDTVWVEILPERTGRIELEIDPQSIPVVNGRSTFRVTNKDANGNLVPVPAKIGFQLIGEQAPPMGCTFGEDGAQEFYGNLSTGEIIVVLHAGSMIGGKLFRYLVWQDTVNYPDEFRESVSSTLSVVAGEPAMLDIDIDSEGEDVGNGDWSVEIATRVWDEFRNPISEDNYELHLAVEPPIAEIVDNRLLIFSSGHVGETVRITATARTEEVEISAMRLYTLPIQDGVLELTVDPQNWMWDEEHRVAEINCTATLIDGHGQNINNVPILFTANRAVFGWKDEEGELHMFYPDAVRMHTDENGEAVVYLIAEEPGDIFLDPFTLEVTVQVNVTVEGHDDIRAEPQFIFFTR